jgi:glycosyltransferase involved in cell wall biosynthesis
MRLFVHDYAGHPFQVQLSRALAARGHTVRHAWCASLPNTAQGTLHRLPDDPPTLDLHPIRLPQPLDKYSYVRRWQQERAYGRLVTEAARSFRPQVVLSGNTPLDAQRPLLAWCRQQGIRFVYWLQDLLGIATDRVLRTRLPVVGPLAGRYYVRLERRLLQHSDAVVTITEDFRPILSSYGLADDHIAVIENWSPLEEMPLRPKENAWAQAHGVADKTCFLYAGNLGMKHNPHLLLQLARRYRDRPDVVVVVVSEGLGADWLAAQKEIHHVDNLWIRGFQPFEALPDVLAAADVLVALLEPDAGVFSVPSKVLSYLCAGRALLLAVPPENLAARIVARQQAGITVPPSDVDGFLRGADTLLNDPAQRTALARRARQYAEQTFNIDHIAERFLRVLAA